MARRIDVVGRYSGIHPVNDNGTRLMQISEETYQRLKRNSERFGDRESYEEIINRLLDFYEKKGK